MKGDGGGGDWWTDHDPSKTDAVEEGGGSPAPQLLKFFNVKGPSQGNLGVDGPGENTPQEEKTRLGEGLQLSTLRAVREENWLMRRRPEGREGNKFPRRIHKLYLTEWEKGRKQRVGGGTDQ